MKSAFSEKPSQTRPCREVSGTTALFAKADSFAQSHDVADASCLEIRGSQPSLKTGESPMTDEAMSPLRRRMIETLRSASSQRRPSMTTRSLRPVGELARRPAPAADQIDPPPSGIQSPRSRPRLSRPPSRPGGIGAHTVRQPIRRPAVEDPNHRHRGLLRPRRKRPRCCRAAQDRDEVAPFHFPMLPCFRPRKE
jgi:hypothetical protein